MARGRKDSDMELETLKEILVVLHSINNNINCLGMLIFVLIVVVFITKG